MKKKRIPPTRILSTEYGFSFNYPKNWTVEDGGESQAPRIVTVRNPEYPMNEGDKPTEFVSLYISDAEECSKTRHGKNAGKIP